MPTEREPLSEASNTARGQRYREFIANSKHAPKAVREPLFTWEPPDTDETRAAIRGLERAHCLRKHVVKELRLHPQSIGVVCMSELLTNAVTHSSLRRVTIWRAEDDFLICEVQDQGKVGRQPYDRPEEEGGLGLDLVALSAPYYGREPDTNTSWVAFQAEYVEAA